MRGRKAKPPFADLPEEFKDAVASMSPEQIKGRIAEVALAQEEMNKAQKEDQDLQEKKEALKYASEPYREGKKSNKLKIQYCRQMLESKNAL